MTNQPCRAEINRANAQRSTGPSSPEGKARSARNSFKHGLYSKELVMPDEDPDELDHLRCTLRDEHQPATTTEEILVDELAQHFWRLRRFRALEARAWTPENLDAWCASGLLHLIQRSMASAERSFSRALRGLRELQAQRGFIPEPSAPAAEPHASVPRPNAELAEEFDDESLNGEFIWQKLEPSGFVPHSFPAPDHTLPARGSKDDSE